MDAKPSIYEEAVENQIWKDSMEEEYQSIMQNDVWDVVPRPKEKYTASSKWIYKMKHAVDGNIENIRKDLWPEVFFIRKGLIMKKNFLP
jgi:hypothetical protein